MLFSFCLALLTALLVALVPGAVALLGSGLAPALSLACAPPVSALLLCLAGIAADALGAGGVIPTLAGTLALSAAVLLAARLLGRRRPREASSPSDWGTAGLYAAVGLVTLGVVFLSHLESLDAFVQFDDNATHLGMIANMMQGGSLSTLNCSSYAGVMGAHEIPFLEAGYYPAAWHAVAAIAGVLSQSSAVVAENATNVAFCSVVYPLGVFALLDAAFGEKPHARAFGAFACLASTAFPLRMLTVHGAFPNMAAFCCVPATVALFVRLLPAKEDEVIRPHLAIPALAGLFGLALVHPNAAIAAGVMLLAYLLATYLPALAQWLRHKRGLARSPLVPLELGMGAIACLVWGALVTSSFMASVINFIWDWFLEVPDALGRILTAGYLVGIEQWVLAVLIAVGAIQALRSRNLRWLALAYAFVAILFVLGSRRTLPVKRLAIGFWYTDPERVTALLAIAAVPLAALGLYTVWAALSRLARRLLGKRHGIDAPDPQARLVPLAMAALVVAGFSLSNYAGAAQHQDLDVDLTQEQEDQQSSFAFSTRQLAKTYRFDGGQCYTGRERAFVQRALSMLPEGSLVLNMPFDGSVFSYAADGLNVYHKSYRSGNETPESRTIRTGLKDISTDPAVRDSVAKVGASYVLVLSRAEFGAPNEYDMVFSPFSQYYQYDWKGFELSEQTAGFELVCSDGDLALYRIDPALTTREAATQ